MASMDKMGAMFSSQHITYNAYERDFLIERSQGPGFGHRSKNI